MMITVYWARRAIRSVMTLCLVLAWLRMGPVAQEAAQQIPEVRNPLAGNPEAIRQGKSLFHRDCAPCHGADASGGRGPDLISGRLTHGESEATLFRIISKGVPGTEMPGRDYKEDEVWMIIAFLRNLAATGGTRPDASILGDRQAGQEVFATSCSQCHRVNRSGGRLGPDLSRIGAARSIRYLTESIRRASKDVPRQYETVVAVTQDGKRIPGIRLNEDTFSLQLMDLQERFQFFLKEGLREVTYERRSLMPDYDEQVLSEKGLQDLLAYLQSLRGEERRMREKE
jgi:cytochrome c oxidase cbb3-type subunit 3